MGAGEPILDSFDGSRPVVIAVAAGIAVWSVAACLLAWWALKGRNWARILLAISAGATVVVVDLGASGSGSRSSRCSAASPYSSCSSSGGANDWYRAQRTRDREELSS